MTAPLQPDLQEAGRFLQAIAGQEAVTFQTFDDDHDRKLQELAQVLHGTLAQHAARLTALQQRGAGVFFMVAQGDGVVHDGQQTCRTLKSFVRVRALFVDFDDASANPLQKIHAAPVKPHLVVESSAGKFHAYWIVRNCAKERFGPLQIALAKHFDSDPKVKDLPRVMRLPGFFHMKGEAFRSSIEELNDRPPYTVEEIVAGLGLQEGPSDTPSNPANPPEARRFGRGQRRPYLLSCGGLMVHRGMSPQAIEAALLAENAARCDPPLSEAEVRAHAAGVARYANSEDWPEPLNIFSDLIAPPFRPQDFPPQIQRFADLFARAAGFDFSGVAVASVVAAAAMLHDEVRVALSPRSRWYESARLWALLIGPPGSGKSPMIRRALAPTYKLHRKLLDDWNRACAAAEETEDVDPPRPALFTSDATIEKLSDLLVANPRGMLYTVDEFDSWIGTHDAYRSGRGSRDRGEWLRLYDGGPHQVDRVSRGSFFVPNWGASLLSATTWAALERHAKNLPSDGLLQRFIPVLLNRSRPQAELLDAAVVHAAEYRYEERLEEIHRVAPANVMLSDEAQEIFDTELSVQRQLVEALETSNESLAAHVSKHGALLGRVALTFHAVEHGEGMHRNVTPNTMRRALGFMHTVFSHTTALHQHLRTKAAAWPLARDLARSLLADGLTTLNVRTANQICRAFRGAEDWARRQALEWLVTAGWLRPLDPFQRYGDYGAQWEVNPGAAERFADIGREHSARRRLVVERLRARPPVVEAPPEEVLSEHDPRF